MRTALGVVLGWFLGCASVHAQEGVLLYERGGLRPGLCVALRIQLSGLAEVTCQPEGSAATLSERIAAAASAVQANDGRLGVLLERDPDPSLVRMYVLSSRTDQAVLSIERIENRPDPDIDRSLALKVRDAYEVVRYVAAQPEAPAPSAALAAAVAPSPASPAPEAAGKPRVPTPASTESGALSPWLMLLDVGGGLGVGPGLRAMSSAALGVGRPRRSSRVELFAGARFYSRRSETNQGAGRVSMVERGPFVEARWLRRYARFEVGGALATQLSFMAAEGAARDGTPGEQRKLSFVLGASFDLRVHLFGAAYARFAPGIELPAPRREWAVDHEPLLRDRPVRVSLPLSLVVLLPLARSPEGLQP